MLNRFLQRYKKAVENPEIVTEKVGKAQDVFTGFAVKTCLVIFFIILLLVIWFFASKQFNSNLVNLIEQQHLFRIIVEEIHQVPFEKLESSRFEKKIDGNNYVFTVIMEQPFSLPVDMMGDTIPGVDDPFVSQWKGYIMRAMSIEIMYLPENLFNLPINAEPQIVKEKFFVIKRSNGDYGIVLFAPVMELYNKNVKTYREDIRRQAEEYIKQRDGNWEK